MVDTPLNVGSLCADPARSDTFYIGARSAIFCLSRTSSTAVLRWTTICAVGEPRVSGFADGPVQNAVLGDVRGLAFRPTATATATGTGSANDLLYFADYENHRIRRCNFGAERAVQSVETVIARGGSIECPQSLVFDRSPSTPTGSVLYVAGRGVICRLDLESSVLTVMPLDVQPEAIDCAPTGVIVFTSYNKYGVFAFDPLTRAVRRLAGAADGAMGYSDGPALKSRFAGPSELVIDATSRSIYVCDRSTHCIRQITIPHTSFLTIPDPYCSSNYEL